MAAKGKKRSGLSEAEKRSVLAGMALLRGVSSAEVARLARACEWHDYARGAVIIGQGSPARDVMFVVKGRVRIVIFAANGRDVSFRDLEPGANFGDLALIDGEMRSASTVARTQTTVAQLPRAEFWRLLRSEPAAVDNLLGQLVRLIRGLTERVLDFSTLGVPSRVQGELVRMAREQGWNGQRGRFAIHPVPRNNEIASRISTNREAVARTIAAIDRKSTRLNSSH